MKSRHFPQVNVTIAKDQPEYSPLQAYVQRETEGPEGYVVFCWQLNDFTMLDVLEFDITDSVPPAVRRQLVRVQDDYRRACRVTVSTPTNYRRSMHHLRNCIRRFRKVRHLVALLPAELFAAPEKPFSEPTYETTPCP